MKKKVSMNKLRMINNLKFYYKKTKKIGKILYKFIKIEYG